MCDTTRSRRIVKDASDLEEVPCSNLVGLAEVDFNPVRRKSYVFCRRTERGKRSFIVLLKKEWSQVRDLTREEREAFRAEREQADAALRVERREAAAAQERLRAETENLRASMEQLQRRVEGQSGFARGEPFAGLGSVGRHEGQLPARRAAGSGFVPAGFQSPRSSVSGDSGTASAPAPRIGENTVSSNVTKQIKDVPFFQGAKAEFPKFKRDLITLAKQHGLFRVFTEDIPVSTKQYDTYVIIRALGGSCIICPLSSIMEFTNKRSNGEKASKRTMGVLWNRLSV